MEDGPLGALDALARKPGEAPPGDLAALWAAYAAERRAGRSPFSSAILVAARADRLGHAFAVGYPAALEHLVPGVALPCALCVTEDGGNSPRAIKTTLRPDGDVHRIDGEKSFVTFGTLAEELIIVARVGDRPDGRPDLTVIRIPADRDGVSVEELPPTAFVPEVVHARLSLHGAVVREPERLPGDGYLRYVKPFRTIEDIHVVGATLGYVVGWARRVEASASFIAELSSALVALDALRTHPPLEPRVHVALHGVYQHVTDLLRGDAFSELLRAAAGEERDRWQRDQVLLRVASKARDARFQRALEDLG